MCGANPYFEWKLFSMATRETIGELIRSAAIHNFSEIFDLNTQTGTATFTKIPRSRIGKFVKAPAKILIIDLMVLADYFHVTVEQLHMLVANEIRPYMKVHLAAMKREREGLARGTEGKRIGVIPPSRKKAK